MSLNSEKQASCFFFSFFREVGGRFEGGWWEVGGRLEGDWQLRLGRGWFSPRSPCSLLLVVVLLLLVFESPVSFLLCVLCCYVLCHMLCDMLVMLLSCVVFVVLLCCCYFVFVFCCWLCCCVLEYEGKKSRTKKEE